MSQNVIFQLLQETNINARYDTEAKKLLGNKEILSRILKYSVKEFENYSIQEIINSIEGEPYISEIRVRPGNIEGLSNTNQEIGEGEITYDIIFYAITPDKQRTKIILNIEAQNKYSPGYDLVTRGIFYGARMLSSQLDREFSDSNYDDIKKVYSIWICKDVPIYARHTITEYKITPHNLWGNFNRTVRYDLLSVIMIRLGESDHEINPLIKLLDTILSEKLTICEKTEILEKDFAIQKDYDKNGGLNIMCNLSTSIEEKGMQKGMLLTLYTLYQNNSISLETAIQNASMTEAEFLAAVKEYTSHDYHSIRDGSVSQEIPY